MDFTPTPFFYLFIGLIIGLIAGWVIGFFDSNGRASKKIKAAESNAELKAAEAERKIAQAEQKLVAVPTVQDDPGLLRLKRQDGRFILEMDGVPVPGELSQDMRKRLIELLTVFRLWLEPRQTPPAAPKPIAPTPPIVEDTVREPVSRPLPSATTPRPPAPIKKPEVEKSIASMSIVQQIDTILQARIMDTPLAKRGIRLQESIEGGVEVYVGLQKFHTVDDVPDEFIKATIRAAIAEWEQKYTPGM
jgi:hypothetical protein